MDTEQLKVFLQIVDSGSIQGAARKLGTTRSSLRRTLEELEAQTGAPFLHRDHEGFACTPPGPCSSRREGLCSMPPWRWRIDSSFPLPLGSWLRVVEELMRVRAVPMVVMTAAAAMWRR
jgi:hypothetical protein